MCGITGILDWERHPGENDVRLAIARMRLRGPDHQAAQAFGAAVLGHARLAVIDLRPEGNQPMSDASGQLHIVFNGEIYNYRELRRELEAQGARFRTESDTEVLLEAYRAWGADCPKRLNGMFAFAIWDPRNETLFLARDRMGEKPLYHATLADGRFLFCSDLAAMRRLPGAPQALSAKGLGDYLALNYVLTEHCIIEGVEKLPPAHALTLRRGRPPRLTCYWDLAAAFRTKTAITSQDEAAEKLAALIDGAVRRRLVSDVPLGAFLSGGIDSSIVVGSMAAAGPRAPQTFTMDFRDPEFSEVERARSAAAHFSSVHREEIIDIDAAASLPDIVASMGEPVADTSIVPMYHLCRFARKSVTVVLSGDGADELFAGYDTYKADRLRHLTSWIPAWTSRGLAGLARWALRPRFGKVSFDYKLQQFLRGHGLSGPEAHYFWRVIQDRQEIAALLRPEVAAGVLGHDPYAGFERHGAQVPECSYIDQALYVDTKTWLVEDILAKVDRASMAHSLEVRVPYLDHELVEFAASLPADWKLRGATTKYLLRRAKASLLAPSVAKGPKRGFNAPVSRWFNDALHDLGRSVTLEGPLTEWVDTGAVEKMWADHRALRRDNAFRLFGLVCLGLWSRMSR